jgi:hypothetical protein
MHPVPGRRLAAEHIEAMTAAAGKARSAPQAHRARPRKGAAPADRGALSGAGHPFLEPGDQLEEGDESAVSLSEIADSVPPAGRSGVPTGIASCTEGEGNAHAAGNR